MRMNIPLLDSSELLAAIVEKIETTYAEDISLFICYGSYVTGNYGALSDIDFFFVPRTRKGYQLGVQFILNDVGYDLWPVSWERLANFSSLEEQIVSILMDGKVLFASSEEDLLKLEDLKKHLQQTLQNEALIRKTSRKYLDKAKSKSFDIQSQRGNGWSIDAIEIAEILLFAVAILNGTYTRKGIKRIEEEFLGFSMKPAGFLETYRKLIRTKKRTEVLHLVNDLILETEALWKARFEGHPETADPSALTGFYEEFKSTYNKLLLACDEKNYENAYYAAFLIDRETASLLVSFAGPGTFPNMIEEVLRNDYDVLRRKCVEHEKRLLGLLSKKGVKILAARDMSEFRSLILEKEG